MKLEDIKKMSDEEFIEFISNFINIEEDIEDDLIKPKTLENFAVGTLSLMLGLIPTSIIMNFSEDSFVLCSAYVAGTIIGIPITKNCINGLIIRY